MTPSAVPTVPAPLMFPEKRKVLLLHFLPNLSISRQVISHVYIRALGTTTGPYRELLMTQSLSFSCPTASLEWR